MNGALHDLLDGYLNQSLDEAQTAELNAQLEQSKDARDELRARIRIHAGLSGHFSENTDDGYQPITAVPEGRRISFPTAWLAAAAALILISVELWPRGDKAIAEIVLSQAAEWSAPVESRMGSGWHELRSGLVELQIGEGVRVAIEGPARFELIDLMHLRIEQGRISALVDEAGHGFTIETPEGDIIDHGTRFGVSVGADGSTEAHVFEGTIEVKGMELSGDKAVRLAGLVPVSSNPWAFPMPGHVLEAPLGNPGFENGTAPAPGMPDRAGHWGGDAVRILEQSPSGSVHPVEGTRMLQFLATRHPDVAGSDGTSASEIWQIVDLRPFADRVNAGEVVAALGAQFNRSAGVPNSDFRIQLAAFRGDMSKADTYWNRKNLPTSERLAATSSSMLADESPESWEALELNMAVPAGSDFLLVSMAAIENETRRDANEFKGHFADAVRLEIRAKARRSQASVRWVGDGNWGNAGNWEARRPDPGRDRIHIGGAGEAMVNGKAHTKQSLVIGLNFDETGRMRIAPGGEFTKSGFGEVIVGFNRGAVAELIVEGSLVTRSKVFIGRNNLRSTVEVRGGSWDAGEHVIRMSQYGKGPDTTSTLTVDAGGRLRAGSLELIHDHATFNLMDGEAELGLLHIGGEDGTARVALRDGRLRVNQLVFGPGEARFDFLPGTGELCLPGEWTAEQVFSIPHAHWFGADGPLTPEDLVLEPLTRDGTRYTVIRGHQEKEENR